MAPPPAMGREPLKPALRAAVNSPVRKRGVSLIQTHLHALIRALALPEISLVELLGRANGLLNQATLPKAYATLVAGRLVAGRLVTGGRVELANGRHPPPLLADARGVRPVKGGGLPLGLFREAGYDHRELFLKPGDTLFLYTDGLTEAATQEGEYGVSRAAAARAAVGVPQGPALLPQRCVQRRRLHARRDPADGVASSGPARIASGKMQQTGPGLENCTSAKIARKWAAPVQEIAVFLEIQPKCNFPDPVPFVASGRNTYRARHFADSVKLSLLIPKFRDLTGL